MSQANSVLSMLLDNQRQRRSSCKVVNSKFILRFLKCLRKHGFIYGVCIVSSKLKVYLRYFNGKPVLSGIKLFSKPGSRKHTSKFSFQYFRQFSPTGLSLLSTQRGLIVCRIADIFYNSVNRGELICFLW